MPKKGEMFHAAWWEIRDDDDGDGPYWYGYCEGDKDGDRMNDAEPFTMDPRFWPVGTRVDVTEPWDEDFYTRLFADRGKPGQKTPNVKTGNEVLDAEADRVLVRLARTIAKGVGESSITVPRDLLMRAFQCISLYQNVLRTGQPVPPPDES